MGINSLWKVQRTHKLACQYRSRYGYSELHFLLEITRDACVQVLHENHLVHDYQVGPSPVRECAD